MLFYLLCYLGAGVLVLIGLRLHGARKVQPSPLDWLPDLEPSGLVDKYLVPAIAFSILLSAWPVLLVLKAWKALFPEEQVAVDEPEAFAVQREHLLERVPLDAIEQAERVVDPLAAVPGAPFGHLNPAWERFKAELQPGAELWRFSASYGERLWVGERYTGYAVLEGERIGPRFIAETRPVDADTEAGQITVQ